MKSMMAPIAFPSGAPLLLALFALVGLSMLPPSTPFSTPQPPPPASLSRRRRALRRYPPSLVALGGAPFGGAPSNDDGAAGRKTLLAKTPETFKLADLYALAADLQTAARGRDALYAGCERLCVDPATGSCLLRVIEGGGGEGIATDTFEDGDALPPALRGCDWLAEEVASGPDASALLCDIRERCGDGGNLFSAGDGNDVGDGWTLEYVCLAPNGPDISAACPSAVDDAADAESSNADQPNTRKPKRRDKKGYNSKTLLACVAQLIPSSYPAALDPDKASTRLLLIEARSGLYLARRLPPLNRGTADGGDTDNRPKTMKKAWPGRPFQYSSAMNPAAARAVTETLLDLARLRRKRRMRGRGSNAGCDANKKIEEKPTLTLLDPTCGSGTFLAEALVAGRGFEFETSAIGWDLNPACVDGTQQNLDYLLGVDDTAARSSVTLRDAGEPPSLVEAAALRNVDCVVANLPWGENTAKYRGENERILSTLAASLPPGIPCAIVGKGSDNIERSLETTGYDVLGAAHVPQRGFRLPGSRKKRKKKKGGDDTEEEGGGVERGSKSGDCVIYFATMPGGDEDAEVAADAASAARTERTSDAGRVEEQPREVGGDDVHESERPRVLDPPCTSDGASKDRVESGAEWATLGQIGTFSNRWLTLIGERLKDDGGQTLDYWRVEKDDSAVVVTIHRGRFVLPRAQYRPGVGRSTLDFPGGRVPLQEATTTTTAAEAEKEEASTVVEEVVVTAILERELGVQRSSIAKLTALNPGGDKGWPVNSSFSNQKLLGFVAVIGDDVELDETVLHPRTYAIDVEADVGALLEDLTCLQCRALLLEYLRQRRS